MNYLKGRDLLALGFMTFALFLGAGNIIFPPSAGMAAGEAVWSAALGFLLTAVGLPLLTVIALARVGGGMDRLTAPLIRENGELREASWDEATTLVAEKFREIIAKHGPDAIAGVSCARSINEDSYQMQKLFRAVIGTNNIDHCART